MGGRLISEDGTQFVGCIGPPKAIVAVQFFSDLYNTYVVAPPPADWSLWVRGNTEFENGQAAMRLFGRRPQGSLRENPNVDLRLVGVPASGVRANTLFWGGLGIFRGTKHPEVDWRWRL